MSLVGYVSAQRPASGAGDVPRGTRLEPAPPAGERAREGAARLGAAERRELRAHLVRLLRAAQALDRWLEKGETDGA